MATRGAYNDDVEGMMHWQRAGALRGALRAIKSSPNEGTVASQTEALKPKFDEPVRNSLYYLLLNFMKVVLGEDRNAWDYFTGNLAYASTQVGKGGAADIRSWAKQIWDQHAFLQATTPQRVAIGTVTKKQQPKKEQPKEKVATPQLDEAIDLADSLSKLPLPEGVKSGIEVIKSSIELARTAKQNGDGPTYTKHVASLAEAMFKTIGELVKSAGQNVELAGKACEQLGKIAKIFGRVAKVITVLDSLSKIIYGKSLAGAKVDQGDQVDAAIDLITTFGGTVGAAAAISLGTFKWIWNHIGVPVKQATEDYGLRKVFGGKTPDELKAEIDRLPRELKLARWVLDKLHRKTFKPIKSPFSEWVASTAWEKFVAAERGYNLEMKDINDAFNRNYTPGANPMLDEQILQMIDRYKSLAHRFIDGVVQESKSWAK